MSVTILGAGPAGLAAADALSRKRFEVQVVERAPVVGGMCRTVERSGNRFDLGGHRFFTRFLEVETLWKELLGDDLLRRPRHSRIFYRGEMFAYPLTARSVLAGLGPIETAKCITSYAKAQLKERGNEEHLQEWVTNRFGERLFQTFFRTYTEKVWGIPCTSIEADWAAQRIKSLDLTAAILDAARRGLGRSSDASVTSLIDWFWYPRLGPGMLFEALAERARKYGTQISLETTVVGLRWSGTRITHVRLRDAQGIESTQAVEQVLSSIPLTHLVQQLDPAPPSAVLAAAHALRFRHLRTVNLILDQPAGWNDQWVYVHDPDVQVGRIQNFAAWSPWMVAEPGTASFGLEYFCSDEDPLWTDDETTIIARAQHELRRTGLAPHGAILDAHSIRVPRAYPVYLRGYEAHLATLQAWLRNFENLQPIGRYGMFKYNNSDHSVLTGLLAAENIEGARHDIWAVNTDSNYHEVRPNAPNQRPAEG